MKYLIGSRALARFDSTFDVREDSDWDIVSAEPIKPFEGLERHELDFLNNREVCQTFASAFWIKLPTGEWATVVNPTGLAIIKRSHLWRDLNFQKHITHYHKHLVQFMIGEPIYNTDEILKRRIELTMKAFPQIHPKLNVTVGEFFDDFVVKKYDHDYLHELFAYEDKPMYTKMQVDPSKAWCEKDMWNRFTDRQKINCVAEEVQVIATERFLVPNDFKFPYKLAYIKALDKVCTTLCSGWFRDFAIDAYPRLINTFDPTRFDKVKERLLND
jgi:hypothetical protein